MSVFFTSDTHYHHKKIIEYCSRPYASVEEMNAQLIANWNSVVGSDDTVYHIGDLSFGNLDFLAKLNGRIVLICGNHDNAGKIMNSPYNGKVSIHSDFRGKIEGQYMHLYHYPLDSWDRRHHGSWHLHGHIHSRNNKPTNSLKYDVGVDNNNYTPISMDQLRDIFAKVGEKVEEAQASTDSKSDQNRDTQY